MGIMEPGAQSNEESIMASLKRIADVAELFAVCLIEDYNKKELDMRDWAHRHGFGDLWEKLRD